MHQYMHIHSFQNLRHENCQTRNSSKNDIFEVYLHDNELPIQLYAPELLARNAIHQQNTPPPAYYPSSDASQCLYLYCICIES